MKQPDQPTQVDDQGVLRYVPNQLVRQLVDAHPGGMNALSVAAQQSGCLEDYNQLLQLLGMSVAGVGDLELGHEDEDEDGEFEG